MYIRKIGGYTDCNDKRAKIRRSRAICCNGLIVGLRNTSRNWMRGGDGDERANIRPIITIPEKTWSTSHTL